MKFTESLTSIFQRKPSTSEISTDSPIITAAMVKNSSISGVSPLFTSSTTILYSDGDTILAA